MALKYFHIMGMGGSVLIYFPTAALLAVMLFYSVGADIGWSLALPWFLGGTFGSMIGFELVKYFHLRSHQSFKPTMQ